MRQLRFYEKNPTVFKAVTLLFKFPPDIRIILAKGVCAIAENEFNAGSMMSDLKSLGPDKVLALYKSEMKRREYDHEPLLRKAMNYLMVLNPEDQFFLSLKLLDLIKVVRDFMALCKRHALSIQLAMVEKLTGTYVRYGLNEAEEFLTVTRVMFERLLSGEGQDDGLPRISNKELFWRSIANETSGMRLRLSWDPS